MLGQKRIKQITDALLARSTADQTEVVILANDEALTRFANSTIHQNVAETDTEVRIRVVGDKRIGVATTNNLSDDSLTRTLETALTMARLQPPNPDFRSLPSPQPLPEVAAFSQATADCSPERRARDVGAICSLAREAGVGAFGALTTAALEIAIANSLGVFAYFPTTYADLVTVAMGDSGSGYASAMALSVDDLDAEAIGREAAEKCLRSHEPRPLPPGEYTVILEPYAVQDMVQMMAYSGFGALALQEGRSFMAGKMGQRIMDARISIWDDGLDPAGLPLPFDFEGVPPGSGAAKPVPGPRRYPRRGDGQEHGAGRVRHPFSLHPSRGASAVGGDRHDARWDLPHRERRDRLPCQEPALHPKLCRSTQPGRRHRPRGAAPVRLLGAVAHQRAGPQAGQLSLYGRDRILARDQAVM